MSSRFPIVSRLIATFVAVTALCFAVTIAAAQPPGPFEVVASGLDNPRGLAFAPNGALYVAEAGKGGPGPCVPGPEGPTICYGETGAVTRIWKGTQKRIVSGLPSLAAEDGSQASGPDHVAVLGSGGLYVTIGLGGNPAERSQFPTLGNFFGHIIHVSASGDWESVADVSAYEASDNPEGTDIDSNPYALIALPGRRIVADAGGNDLLQANPDGTISTLAVFPDRMVPSPFVPGQMIPMEAVPTCVTQGPDGAYYVGQLTGFPFVPGAANIFRVEPGKPYDVALTGFTNIIDLAFDADGNLYVLEIFANGLLSGNPTGALIRVDPQGNRTTLASDGLVTPTGLAIGRDGAIYISNYGTQAGIGQVIRIPNAAPSGPLMYR